MDRAQVLAYRVCTHQLDRSISSPADLAVLDLGVQDTPYGAASQALAARLPSATIGPDVALVWAARGAPHLHRLADLPALAAALWPRTDADATARINVGPIRQGARLGRAAFTAAATALHEVVREPMKKGEVSTGVSARVPAELTYWCETCGAQHISGALFQQVGVAAGVTVEARGNSTWLAPLPSSWTIPDKAAGTDAYLAAYLRLLGPATPAEAARFLGTTVTEARRAWPDPAGLAEVDLAGRTTWLPADRLDALHNARPDPDLVRLLPPSDPYLAARDRDLLAPDKRHQAALWRPIGNPGALLVGAEIAGTWRARLAGRKALDVTVTPFGKLPPKVRRALDAEAATLAAVRDVPEARLVVDD